MAFTILFIWAFSPETQGNESFLKMNNSDDFQAIHYLLNHVNFFIVIIFFLCTSMFHVFLLCHQTIQEFSPVAHPRMGKLVFKVLLELLQVEVERTSI